MSTVMWSDVKELGRKHSLGPKPIVMLTWMQESLQEPSTAVARALQIFGRKTWPWSDVPVLVIPQKSILSATSWELGRYTKAAGSVSVTYTDPSEALSCGNFSAVWVCDLIDVVPLEPTCKDAECPELSWYFLQSSCSAGLQRFPGIPKVGGGCRIARLYTQDGRSQLGCVHMFFVFAWKTL